jgi:hypothetical protein
MSFRAVLVAIVVVASAAAPRAQAPVAPQVYAGVISESMCGITHTSMGITPDPKCIVECVKHGQGVRYVLVEAKTRAMYTLSDQRTPEKFAAMRVRVTGVLYPKTKILKVEKIEMVK